MSAGLHGENGLDPETCIHLLRTYVIPILTYGLEIYIPSVKDLRPMELFLKKVLKQILSIPTTTADPASFILSGMVPVEAIVHLRVLSLFGIIALLDDSSVEKRLAYRQLTIHGQSGGSWFSHLSIIMVKYGLCSPMEILQKPMSKCRWKTYTTNAVYTYWMKRIKEQADTYSSLEYLSACHYSPGTVHPLMRISESQTQIRETSRLAVKTKLVTGTYSLQSTRAAFNNMDVDPTCLLCKSSPETIEHLVLHCVRFHDMRQPILEDISYACGSRINYSSLCSREQLELILDVYSTVDVVRRRDFEYLANIDRHTRRLCFTMHCERNKVMSSLPTRKRYGL